MRRIILSSFAVISLLSGGCKSDKKSENPKEIEKEMIISTPQSTSVVSNTSEDAHKENILIEEEKSEKEEKKTSESTSENVEKPIKKSEEKPNLGYTPMKGDKVFSYQSEDGKNATVIFRGDAKRNYIVVLRNGKFAYELEQDEAWAKGAIYKKDSITMEFDFDKATLKVGKEKTEYKGDKEFGN